MSREENERGDDGNAGIIRSPVRAIVLPDRNNRSMPSTLPLGREGANPLRLNESFVRAGEGWQDNLSYWRKE